MKSKKILAGILAVTMIFGTAISGTNVLDKSIFGITASAVTPTTVDVLTVEEFTNAINNNTNVIINVKADLSGYAIEIQGSKNITINLHGHTIVGIIYTDRDNTSVIKINGSGTVKGSNGVSEFKYGYFGINIIEGSSLTAENVKFIGGNAIGENTKAMYGLMVNNSTATLKNCYVQGGISTGSALSSGAIYAYDSTIYLKDCTLAKGTGGSENSEIINGGTIYDSDTGKAVSHISNTNKRVVGKGYSSVIKETDDTPANADTNVSATSKIPAPTYTVTIPATIDFENVSGTIEKYRNKKTDSSGKSVVATKEFTVSATSVDNLFDGKYLSVSIGATGHKTLLFNETTDIECTLKKGTAVYTEGTEFANFVNDYDLAAGKENKQVGYLSFNRADIKTDGIYTGILTFNVSVKEG